MRNLVLREALRAMAADAALRLHELLAAGAEIPYEVREPSDDSPIAEYLPQTARFIRDHVGSLRELDGFGAGCAAFDSSELSGPYLEELGVPVPPEPRRRAELAGVVFLCRLWQGSTDFTLDEARLEATIDEIVGLGDAREGEIEIVVPLRGFQMPVERLDLGPASIVRGDTVEVPNEARLAEGLGGAAWEPTFLACTRLDAGAGDDSEGADIGARAVEAFRRLITTLRLFKQGGVGLGPHAWTRVGGDRWRRISTGAGRPRPGGYRLADSELGELTALARALASPSTPFGRASEGRDGFPATLARSISRFEAGIERHAVLESLNDFLLSLRFLLEGAGPAGLGLPMRVGALCAEPESRDEVKATVDRAVALERELWSGEPASVTGSLPPADVVAEVEELARAILKDAACGHLGADLRATADEILLADGLAAGEGDAAHRGGTAEWAFEPDDGELAADGEPGEALAPRGLPLSDDELTWEEPAREPIEVPELAGETIEIEAFEPELPGQPGPQSEPAASPAAQMPARAQNKIFEMPLPEEHPPEPAPTPGGTAFEADATWQEPPLRSAPSLRDVSAERPEAPREAAEGPVEQLIAESDAHRRDVADRVSFLFPPPETCEWSVREIGYDRRRRAEVSEAS